MRRFETQGRVYPEDNYFVPRTANVADFITRVKAGRYIVLFAPRQTGKTTFFRVALDELARKDSTYFPIYLNFEVYEDCTPSDFYGGFAEDIHEKIVEVFQTRGEALPETLTHFLENAQLADQLSLRRFFRELARLLKDRRVVLIVDEFDAIPRGALKGFLRWLRDTYLSGKTRCPHSVCIVGVKSITQLDYDRSISPFNIQDEFQLPNFTFDQVRELLSQYTDEVGQTFAPEVITSLHKQTAGQPFLVNRWAQILTDELDVPKTESLTMTHFAKTHKKLLTESNTNIEHLRTNVRRDRRFENILLQIASYESGVPFNPDDPLMNDLLTYGVIAMGADGMCEIVTPIYQHRILQIFKPTFNGLEDIYFAKDSDVNFIDYLTATGELKMESLLDNFQAFIARAGFRVLQVPETPQEYVGQHLLYAYLDHFVRIVGANMFLEVQTGRGRIDLLILHNQRKYIIETKIWEGDSYYQAGKRQLAAYLKLEGAAEGYYIVFDHRIHSESQQATETVDGVKIRSYVIPVMQKRPSSV